MSRKTHETIWSDLAIPDYVRTALYMPMNYSHEFSERIVKIGNVLSQYLGTPLRYDGDMNYRAGKSLSLSLSARPPHAFSESGNIVIGIYFSSRSDLFCFFCTDETRAFVEHGESAFFVSPERFPEPIQNIMDECRNILNGMGIKEVENRFLTLEVPDCFTELDGFTATVFQVLFAEIT
jgi:hypothetical protein